VIALALVFAALLVVAAWLVWQGMKIVEKDLEFY